MAQEPNLFDPEEESGFFSDMKVLISLLAFVLSCIALAWTFTNKMEEEQRWSTLNNAHLVLQDAKMLPAAKFSLADAAGKPWGYPPTLFNGDLQNEALLYSVLMLRDAKSAKPLEAAHRVNTVDEATQEMARLNLTADQVVLARVLRAAFALQNIGRTMAHHVILTAEMQDPSAKDSSWHPLASETLQSDIGPTQSRTARFDVPLPLDALPKTLSFRLHAEYEDDSGKARTADLITTWDGLKNVWN